MAEQSPVPYPEHMVFTIHNRKENRSRSFTDNVCRYIRINGAAIIDFFLCKKNISSYKTRISGMH